MIGSEAGEEGLADVEEAGAAGGPQELPAVGDERVAADRVDVDGELADGLGGVEDQRHARRPGTAAPTSSAGLTSPEPVGTWISDTKAVGPPASARSRASRSTWPWASSPTRTSSQPVRSRSRRRVMALAPYSARVRRIRSPPATGKASTTAFHAVVAESVSAMSVGVAPMSSAIAA